MSQPRDVALTDLRLGQMLDRGGQGEVWSVDADPGLVFKKYLHPRVNDAALADLVEFPARLGPADRQIIEERTAWPSVRVMDGRRTVGFLMRRVPSEFTAQTARSETQLRELQYLLYEPKPFWGSIIPLDAARRVALTLEFIEVIRVLHRHKMVLGDISMRNVLWSDEPRPKVFVLDCDSAKPEGGSPVLPQADTPDWGDPLRTGGDQDVDTDRYKVALLVGRVLSANAYVRPGDELDLLEEIEPAVAYAVGEVFELASASRGERPDADSWARALNGRGSIQLTPPVARTPMPSLPMVDLDSRGEREMIQLRPFPGQP